MTVVFHSWHLEIIEQISTINWHIHKLPSISDDPVRFDNISPSEESSLIQFIFTFYQIWCSTLNVCVPQADYIAALSVTDSLYEMCSRLWNQQVFCLVNNYKHFKSLLHHFLSFLPDIVSANYIPLKNIVFLHYLYHRNSENG